MSFPPRTRVGLRKSYRFSLGNTYFCAPPGSKGSTNSRRFRTRVRERGRSRRFFSEKSNISREALKKIDDYNPAVESMVYFLNTAWTGRRFCLKRSNIFLRKAFSLGTCAKNGTCARFDTRKENTFFLV